MIDRNEIETLVARWQRARADRRPLDTVWEELARLFRPSRVGFVTEHSIGSTAQQVGVYDSVQAEAARDLSHAIEAMLFPPNRQWARMTSAGRVEDVDDDAKIWLADTSDAVLEALREPGAGFGRMRTQALADLPVFGAAAAWIDERPTLDGLLYRPLHLRNVHWLTDYAGNPDTVFHRCELTTRQLRQQWPNASFPDEIARLRDDAELDRKREILNVCLPRRDADPESPLPRDMRWASLVIDVATRHLIHEGGWRHQPFLIPTWELLDNSDIWSPARQSLPDVLTLQAMKRTLLRVAHQAADPTKFMPADVLMGPLLWKPGSVNYFDPNALSPTGKLVETVDTGKYLPITLEMIEAERRRVAENFLRYTIRLPDKAEMTATEVLRHNQDFFLLTSTVFQRVERDFTKPVVEAQFAWMMERSRQLGHGPQAPLRRPPESLWGSRTEFEFLSPLSKANQSQEILGFANAFVALMPFFQARPDLIDNYDLDRMARDVMETMVSGRYLVPRETVQGMRDARDQVAEQQSQLATAKGIADTARAAAPMARVLQAA